MSSDLAIKVENLSKCYQIYEIPRDRLKQFVFPKVQRMLGMQPKQYFREFWALKDVSFNIKKGETIGIIGSNGSGKSTLLQMICGTLNPTGGRIQTNGRVAALLELGSGFNPEFTGRENVYLNGSVLGLSREEIDGRFDQISEFADIGAFIDQPVKTYSSGMFVRLAFAIQANVDPEILIVDEALAVGDAYFVHRCMLRINDLQRAGTTILFVSHDANAVRNLCSRTVWLKEGGIKAIGHSSKVVDEYLAHLFDRKIVTTITESLTTPTEISQTTKMGLPIELIIPNIDRRLGDQKCQIVGVGLYDEFFNKISSSLNDSSIFLRMTIQNQNLKSGSELMVGYILRNAKGQEIASTNSIIEKEIINSPPKNSYITVRIKVTLPCFHPGSYAFSLTAGYIKDGGEIALSDRIENAIPFNLLSDKKVHVLMSLPTIIQIEN
jgi:lipopolysaccharide transport system ATP-binding protein